MSPDEILQDARQLAMEWRPWYCPFLARFTFVPREGKQPLFHDQYGRIYYNESYVGLTKTKHLAVLLLQIAEMFTRAYQFRGGGRDPQLWSFACLLDTASSLQRQGFKLPRESLKPGWFRLKPNMPAEYYYAELEKRERFTIPFTAIDGRGRPVSIKVEMWWEDGKLQFNAEDFAVAGGFEDSPGGVQGLQFLLDPLLFTGIQQEVYDAAAEFGEQIVGDAPDWLMRKANVEESVLPWHVHIRDFLGERSEKGSASQLNSFLMPSLISPLLPRNIILPYQQRKSPLLALVIDTSASMNQELLARCLGELDGLLRSLQIEDGITVIPTDAAAHTVQKVFRAVQLDLEGNGGTNLAAGLNRAAELPQTPEAVIVFTDGYTPWPEEKPSKFDTMVVVVSKQWPKPDQKKRHPAPSWAKVVEMFPWTGA